MKKFILFFLFFLNFAFAQNEVNYKNAVMKIFANGHEMNINALQDQSGAFIYLQANDSLMRNLVNYLGGIISWKENEKLITIDKEIKTARFKIGSNDLEYGDIKVCLLYPPIIFKDIPYIPLEALPGILQAKLNYNEETSIYYFDPLINKIELKEEPQINQLIISASASINFKYFILKEPSRFVIDIPNTILDIGQKEIIHEKFGKIYFDQYSLNPNIVRVVIPLGEDLEVEAASRVLLNQIVLNLKLPQSVTLGQNFSLQTITDLKAEKQAEFLIIKINASGPIQYEWHRLKEPDNRIFIDIPQAVLKIKENKITFDSPYIEEAATAQFQKDPPIVRIVLHLKEAVFFDIHPSAEKLNQIILKIKAEKIIPQETIYTGTGATSFPAKGKIICLDPGHGGSDSGALNPKFNLVEKVINLDLAQRLSKILSDAGYNVILTRDTDRDVTYPGSDNKVELGTRAKIANDLNADIFISLHCNSMYNISCQGSSTHWYLKKDYVLAKAVQNALTGKIKHKDCGLIRSKFYVLRKAKMPSILVETVYMSNPVEGNLLTQSNFRQKIAQGIFDGIKNYFNDNE
ncbi:MAG: N-acetylmuramoyl-L-alanine amidase [Armatimonadetes bacterium]|nr:N-acetylmuramoyl-L-alanine amidase [Armatimonadota bacterium]